MEIIELEKYIKDEIKILHSRIGKFKSNSKKSAEFKKNKENEISSLIEMKTLKLKISRLKK